VTQVPVSQLRMPVLGSLHRLPVGAGYARYALRRAAASLATVAFVLVFNFFLFRLLPGDPIALYTRGRNMGAEQIRELRAQLDRPIGEQFLTYLANPFANVDSVRFNRGVWDVIGDRAWPTILLLGVATIIATVVGIAIGIRSGWNRGSRFDRWATGSTLTLYAMPEFWLGMLLLVGLGAGLGLFPLGGVTSVTTALPPWLDVAWHLALPATTLALAYLAEYSLVMRSSVLDEVGEDYLTTARAKGLRDVDVRRRHAVPNALLPTTTLIFLNLGFVVSGAITVEAVFSWPGLGLLSYEALRGPDVPLLQALFLLFSLSVVGFNLLADLIYGLLDPRVTT
jgi:peptide/nickel transport system permease protein